MADNLHFELVSPERLLRSAEVYMVVVPGTEGDFGVLAGHAPLMSTIRPGAIAIYETEGAAPQQLFIDGGFAEVSEDGLTILAENAMPIGEIRANEVTLLLADAREDIRLAKTEGERLLAEKYVAKFEAMLALATN